MISKNEIAALQVLPPQKVATMELCSHFHDGEGGEFICNAANVGVFPIRKGLTIRSSGLAIVESVTGDDLKQEKYKGDSPINTNFDALFYGVLYACGPYQLRTGHIEWDFPSWPPPPGALIVHNTKNPFITKTQDGLGEIHWLTCYDVRFWYLPGKFPRWAREAAKSGNALLSKEK